MTLYNAVTLFCLYIGFLLTVYGLVTLFYDNWDYWTDHLE